MVYLRRFLLGLAYILSVSCMPAASEAQRTSKTKPSEFRPSIDVQFIYKQYLGGPYTTAWYGRLEKQNGAWRDVYFETNLKFITKGVISFNCDDPNQNIGIFKAPGNDNSGEFDKVIVTPSQVRLWASGDLDSLAGEDPPYEMYVIAHSQYC